MEVLIFPRELFFLTHSLKQAAENRNDVLESPSGTDRHRRQDGRCVHSCRGKLPQALPTRSIDRDATVSAHAPTSTLKLNYDPNVWTGRMSQEGI